MTTVTKSVSRSMADINNKSVKESLRTARKTKMLKDDFRKEADGVKLVTEKATQKRVGKRAKIYVMPTNTGEGYIKMVREPAAAIARIYHLKRESVIDYVMDHVKLANNIKDWEAIPSTKALRIPSLNHMKRYLLNPMGEVKVEKHFIESLMSYYDNVRDTTAKVVSGEGSFEITRKIFSPFFVGTCFIGGWMTVKFGITMKLEPKSRLKIKHKIKYSRGSTKGWKPEATIFAALTQGEIASEIEASADKLTAKLKHGDFKTEMAVGRSISVKLKSKVFAVKINDHIWKVETYGEMDFKIDFVICLGQQPVPVPIPVPNYGKFPKPKHEEFWLWGLLFGIGAKIFELLDRLSKRWAPIMMPPWMIEQFEQRTKGQMA